jgi:hypothetical protein
LRTVYPEYNWKKPERKPNGHWDDLYNQKAFFDELAIRLNIKKPEDWYSVSVEKVMKMGGSFIHKRYNGSLMRALSGVYPRQQWKEPRKQMPSGYWKDTKNQRLFFDKLASKLGLQKPEDWYSVSVDTVMKMGGWFIAHHHGSLMRGK